MYTNSYKVIAVTPAGRKRYLEILVPYILANRDILDEYHLWVNTANEEDISYMQKLQQMYPDFVYLFYTDTYVEGHLGDSIGNFFKLAVNDPNIVYIRFDDDICFIEKNCIKELVKFRIDNKQYFLVSGNVLLNGICAFLHQSVGVEMPEPLTCHIYQPAIIDNPWFVGYLHDMYLWDIYANNMQRYNFGAFTIPDYGHFSVNCVAYFGSDFYEMCQKETDLSWEEMLISSKYPRSVSRECCACGSAIVAHFSFFNTRPFLEENTDLLMRYRDLRDQYLCATYNYA